MTFTTIHAYEEWTDLELREEGRNAPCRSIVLTLERGVPSYAIVRRSQTPDSEFGDKGEFVLGDRAFAALAALWEQHSPAVQ